MNKILIIEDEMDIAELQKDYLSINGYEVDIENDGVEGFERALNNDYSLIIIDIMLPNMDGFEICKELRRVKMTPIIMVTAKQESIDKIRGLGLGADDYIVKPFDPSELVARVKRNIERYESLTNKDKEIEEMIFSNLKIIPKSRQVFVDNEEVKLTNKEFDLLEFLARNKNIVFTKEQLFDRIWGMESLGEISTVTVHINRIREKIEKGKYKYIETVWGTGYKFIG
ncbi:MAG: response regulator transcription factor [Andreesenia angusta]|nr:response regulator transcription factor [Andreesenia angusta]